MHFTGIFLLWVIFLVVLFSVFLVGIFWWVFFLEGVFLVVSFSPIFLCVCLNLSPGMSQAGY